jgi:hypothetical protein
MKRMFFGWFRNIAAVVCCAAAPAFAATPTFTNITDSNAIPSRSFFVGGVNNSGVATFWTSPNSNGTSPDKVYTGSGASLFTVADTAGPYFGVGNSVINNGGTVAFGAELDAGGTGIFARTGSGSFVTVADTSGPLDNLLNPTIADNGHVAFGAHADAGYRGYYRASTGGGVLVTLSDDPGPRSNHVYTPSVNSSGVAAFLAVDDATGAIGLYSGSDSSNIFTHSMTGLNNFGSPDINSAGTLALSSTIAIVKVSGTTVTGVADVTSDPYSSFSSITDVMGSPGIADNGTVIFGARLDAGGAGIFTGHDPVNDKIIVAGDPLFGSTLTHFAIGPWISDDGSKVVFGYELANGTRGVAVATVPEPSGALVAGVTLLAGLMRIRKKG